MTGKAEPSGSRSDEPVFPQVWVDVPAARADDAAVERFGLGASRGEQRDDGTRGKGAASGMAALVARFADRAVAEAAVFELDPTWSPRFAELVGDAWRDAW